MLSNATLLANFVLIQPRTSPPKICKFCKILENAAFKFANFAAPSGYADGQAGPAQALVLRGAGRAVSGRPVKGVAALPAGPSGGGAGALGEN